MGGVQEKLMRGGPRRVNFQLVILRTTRERKEKGKIPRVKTIDTKKKLKARNTYYSHVRGGGSRGGLSTRQAKLSTVCGGQVLMVETTEEGAGEGNVGVELTASIRGRSNVEWGADRRKQTREGAKACSPPNGPLNWTPP